jgi:hypothetical protein
VNGELVCTGLTASQAVYTRYVHNARKLNQRMILFCGQPPSSPSWLRHTSIVLRLTNMPPVLPLDLSLRSRKSSLGRLSFRLRAYGFRLRAYGLRLSAQGFRLRAYGFRLRTSGLRIPAYGFRPTAYLLPGFVIPPSSYVSRSTSTCVIINRTSSDAFVALTRIPGCLPARTLNTCIQYVNSTPMKYTTSGYSVIQKLYTQIEWRVLHMFLCF